MKFILKPEHSLYLLHFCLALKRPIDFKEIIFKFLNKKFISNFLVNL